MTPDSNPLEAAMAFQCDGCHFVNIKKRHSVATSQKDKFLLVLIRVASIDAFWSVEPSTVATNSSQARRMEAIGEECGMDSVSPPLGPFRIEDILDEGSVRPTPAPS
jgi:hypothetical protein